MMRVANNHKRYNWKLFGVLYAAALFGVVCLIPYMLDMLLKMPDIARLLATFDKPRPGARGIPPLVTILILQFLQMAVMLMPAVGLGVLLANKIGCGAPLVENWLAGEKITARNWAVLRSSIATGAGVGLVLLLLLVFVFIPLVPPLRTILAADVALWKKFLAAFYGGITEEVLLRLFLFSLIAWLLGLIWRAPDRLPSVGAMWLANVLAAIIFGLAHLPSATMSGAPITPLLVFAVLTLNGIASLTFGYLYWKRGLEAAVIAHFFTDVVLYVFGTLVVRA
jgi:membrane protease YdiL (CAAX protease family)